MTLKELIAFLQAMDEAEGNTDLPARFDITYTGWDSDEGEYTAEMIADIKKGDIAIKTNRRGQRFLSFGRGFREGWD